jgi:hypothetical protein
VALTKFLARDLVIEILDPASGGDYVEIKGMESLTHSPSTTQADTTDFESGGRKEHLVAERGDEWTLAGYKLEDVGTGDYDPGQALVEALGKQISVDSIGTFRITSPGGNTLTFQASAEVTQPGGGHNDPAAWGAKLTVTGLPQYA